MQKRSAPAADTASGSATSAFVAALLGYSGDSMSVPTVYRCVELIAGSVASLPLHYMAQRNSGRFEDDFSTPLNYLLRVQPDSYLSASDFWKQAVRYLLIHGNAYIVPVLLSGEIVRLALPSPLCVGHDTVADIYSVNDLNAGIAGKYREGEIIHLKNYSADGKRGISTLTHARNAIKIAGAGGAEILNRFTSGGAVKGIVGNDTSVTGFGELQDEELSKAAVDIDSKFQAGQRIVSLPGQVHFNQLSMSSADLQFLETMKFSVPEICRFFGVPPSFVFADTATNYKSAESANAILLTNAVNPILTMIEGELHRKLVPQSLAFKRRFVFDRSEFCQGDPSTRVAYQKATIEAGLYTVNEWRSRENKPPVEGGDEALVSANLKGLKDLNNNTPAEPTATSGQKNTDNEQE